ncbi:DNA polymerase III subunit epsilon [Hyphomicrobiales bacterium]|nr:DNA polymerase III subunit epsilon [Hyphomicrobiales bacterium]
MREIVLDTETTGLSPNKGDRVVEIGCVELINHVPTENTFQVYLNPERDMDEGAQRVHGLTNEFLIDKPKFSEIAEEFISYIGESKIIAHNASFDINFLNSELARVDKSKISDERVVDTLKMAREKYPGARNSLDALCKRFLVDNSNRKLHGALLDSELLAEVYLELIGGKEPDLALAVEKKAINQSNEEVNGFIAKRDKTLKPRLTEEEQIKHKNFIETLKVKPLWYG